MSADLTVVASTLDDARATADRQFEEFFGHCNFEVLEESAWAESVDVSISHSGQSVISFWRCDFQATAVA